MRREKIHAPYYAIKGYQILQKMTDDDMARELGMSTRSYRDKREGYGDFTLAQAETISNILCKDKSEIFLT